MKVVTPAEMSEMDRQTIAHGIADYELMERAGHRCFDVIDRETADSANILVLCGAGNNGGDGQVVARLCFNRCRRVRVLFVGNPDHFTPNSERNFKRLQETGVPFSFFSELNDEIEAMICDADVIVDAVLGNGLKNRPLYPNVAALFACVNRSKAMVYAIDIPSGLRGSNGLTVGQALEADRTLIIQNPKMGMLLEDGPDFLGQPTVLDVGISEQYTASQKKILDEKSVPLIRQRLKNSNKYDYGAVSIVAGSRGMIGAGLMSSAACLKSGAGLVTTWVPESIYDIVAAQMPWEVMVKPYTQDNIISQLKQQRATAYVIGPGIGRKMLYVDLIKWLIETGKPVVIDADGLYHLTKIKSVLLEHKGPVILTPHAGEFCRLCDISKDAYRENSTEIASAFAAKYKVVLVLKGYRTRIFVPHGDDPAQCEIWFNTTGNPGMATAGSGDILTGIIAGLISQTASSGEAARLGVYLHGLSGDIAADQLGQCALNATDLLDILPESIHNLQKECE